MTHETHVIGGNPHVTLSTYLLDDLPVGEARPLVVVCPGGGFLGCSPNEGAPVAKRFNQAGYHAAVLVYSTAQSAPDVPAWPQDLYDLAESMCLIRQNAANWSVDVDRIAILGFSAGGQVCANYGNYWHTDLLANYGMPELRRPNAVVLCYPLVDYHGGGMAQASTVDVDKVLGEGKQQMMDTFKQVVQHALIGDQELTEDVIQAISPLYHVSEDTPPTFIWTTFGDGLLDPIQSLRYAHHLNEKRIPCELHIFQEGAHGISLADETTAHQPEGINPHVGHWAQLAAEWLDLTFGK